MLLDKPSLSTAVKELFASIVTFPSRTVSARFEETSNVSTLRRCSTFTSQVKKKTYQIFTSVDIQGQCPYCYSNHAFRMVEELDCFSVQGEIILVLHKKTKLRITLPYMHIFYRITII